MGERRTGRDGAPTKQGPVEAEMEVLPKCKNVNVVALIELDLGESMTKRWR